MLEQARQHGTLQDMDDAHICKLRDTVRRRAESIGDQSQVLLHDAFAAADEAVKTATAHLATERLAEIEQLIEGTAVTALFRNNVAALEGMFGATRIDKMVVMVSSPGGGNMTTAENVEQVDKKIQAISEHGVAVAVETLANRVPALRAATPEGGTSMSDDSSKNPPQKSFVAHAPYGRAVAAENYNENNYSGPNGPLEGIDIPTLHAELRRLREAMQAEAGGDLEKMKAVLAVNAAETDAAANKAEGLSDKLKAAGAWALDVAQKIGVAVATAAISRSLGLK
jgi:hypothetical protein